MNWSTSIGVNFEDLGQTGDVKAVRAIQVDVLPRLSNFQGLPFAGDTCS